jgi:hypothetical protein
MIAETGGNQPVIMVVNSGEVLAVMITNVNFLRGIQLSGFSDFIKTH